MSKIFKYLNLTEADIKLLDPETLQMGQVVELMQNTYASAPDGKKKDVLANVIAETVALVLARTNSIKGLSRDAKKKIEEEAKELPKAVELPKEEPKQEAPKEKPKPEAPKKEKPMPEPESEPEPETEEEIKSAISGLSILAKFGDEEAKTEIKRLKAKLKKK
jgi:outer membrane biosynthesis protein TonB